MIAETLGGKTLEANLKFTQRSNAEYKQAQDYLDNHYAQFGFVYRSYQTLPRPILSATRRPCRVIRATRRAGRKTIRFHSEETEIEPRLRTIAIGHDGRLALERPRAAGARVQLRPHRAEFQTARRRKKMAELPYELVSPKMLAASVASLNSAIGAAGGRIPPIFIRTAADQTDLSSAKLLPFTDYFAMRDSIVTFPLPATAAAGDKFYVLGGGAGGWRLTQTGSAATGQIIHGAIDTTRGSGGSLSSGFRYDTIRIACVVADTEFLVISKQGNHIYV